MVPTSQQTDIKNGGRSSQAQKGMHLQDSFWYWPIIHCLYFLGRYVDPIRINQVSQKGNQTVEELALMQFQVKLVLLQMSQNFLHMVQMQLHVFAVN